MVVDFLILVILNLPQIQLLMMISIPLDMRYDDNHTLNRRYDDYLRLGAA